MKEQMNIKSSSKKACINNDEDEYSLLDMK